MFQEHIFPNFITYILVTPDVTHSKWCCVNLLHLIFYSPSEKRLFTY